ncbi:hypothetical protein DFQ27_004189 [Actinomortierella ambigua]|uniref:PH domain-containing protein n=1 Tax=Actinomortierella ambigua TaxID=1343610 RepID=A0A9P6Q613_9FUNG|nr:hypothetical protein DFQ27_004189 [Actinomortierella ambigua]
MQGDTFKRFSKDLQEALVIPVNFLNKKSKRPTPQTTEVGSDTSETKGAKGLVFPLKKNKRMSNGIPKLDKISMQDSCSLHNFSLTDLSKKSSNSSLASKLNSPGPKSPLGSGYRVHGAPKNNVALIHCPRSVATLEQFSPHRLAWIKSCLQEGSSLAQLSAPPSVLKTEQAWDTAEDSPYGEERGLNSTLGEISELMAQQARLQNSSQNRLGYNNLNEPTGLLLVKLMQVNNKSTNKLYDIEWTLKVGNVERISHPSRSVKDHPGNTAMMNEVFLFDVNEEFHLEMSVSGLPITSKFGTMAGFTNNQSICFGQLQLAFSLEPMEKSVRTYKLRRPAGDGTKTMPKNDVEVVVMIGLHVLEEPIEDRSWETEVLYQGNLTIMTRGPRMAAWKRYWVVLDGLSLKLYDAEYQQKRDALATIPLAQIQTVQPPDYDKVDVSANGFSMKVFPHGVDMTQCAQYVDLDVEDMDYSVYAFADSAYLHDVWNANIEEALDQHRQNMERRLAVHHAKLSRRASHSLSRHSSKGSVPLTPLEEEVVGRTETIDLKFVF